MGSANGARTSSIDSMDASIGTAEMVPARAAGFAHDVSQVLRSVLNLGASEPRLFLIFVSQEPTRAHRVGLLSRSLPVDQSEKMPEKIKKR